MTLSSESRDGGRPRSGSRKKVVLPDVKGLLVPDARIVLTQSGFGEPRLHYVEDYAPEKTVINQAPGPGLFVDVDREIILTVSRKSLIQYLPRIYQQADTVGFTRGFLTIIQQVNDRVSDRLDRVDQLFDPRTADADFLPWLAGWLNIGLNPEWTVLQTRKMMLAATRLFPFRGTAYAIAEFVRIYTDAKVVVEENSWPFPGFRIGVHSTVGEDTVILPEMNLAHCFVVRVDRPASQVADDEIIRIHQIIQQQKPAHTAYFLAFQDEAESGVMGVFMEIGTGYTIGVGIIGLMTSEA